MRILFLTYYFPPDPAVGAIRAGALYNAFRRAGHDVTVISRRIAESERDAHVLRVPTLPNPRDLLIRFRDLFRRGSSANESNGAAGAYRVPENVPSWKRFLLAMALMPDDYHGFIWPAVLRAVPHLLRGIDLVYTSGPPHSVHLAGLTLAHLTNVRWAAEFRDPWTDNAIQPRYGRSETADRVRHWLERLCMRRADDVITVTAAAGEILSRKAHGHVLVAPNGIAQEILGRNGDFAAATTKAPTGAREAGGGIREQRQPVQGARRILYMGNLYHRRDPNPLIQALAALRRRGRLPDSGVQVDLYGDCAWFNGVSVAESARQAGVDRMIRIHGRVPLEEARRLTLDADLLLLLAQDQPLQVPQKLYEYVAAKRPIIAFTDRDCETANILESLGGHYLIYGNDVEQAEHALERALHARLFEPPPPDRIADLSAERQMDRLVRVLAVASAAQRSPRSRG